jgi:hypothetical protein
MNGTQGLQGWDQPTDKWDDTTYESLWEQSTQALSCTQAGVTMVRPPTAVTEADANVWMGWTR